MSIANSLEFAIQLDEDDLLGRFREKFFIPKHHGHDAIYFNGNSLGLQPVTVASFVQQELNDWASLAGEAHFHGKNPWLSYHEIFPPLLAPVVGCQPTEVVVMDQLTVNLHLLMVSFYRPTKKRYRIICEAKAFPSDQYALASQVKFHGFDPNDAIIEIEPRAGEHLIHTEDILSAIEQYGESVALVLFGGINYYTGQFFDLRAISAAAHRVGAYAGFDLAHAAGNVKLELHDWNVDFACWCSYKYLNSGPGGVSGVFIHQKHHGEPVLPRFAGWWGHDKQQRFKMEKTFEPIPTAEGWQISNAPVLSMAAHRASLEIFAEAGMEKIFAKAKLLTGYLHFILNEVNREQQESLIEIITPSNERERGSQVSMLMMRNGKAIFQALAEQGIFADWREPNVIRVAPVPLYNRFTDVWKFGEIIKATLGIS